VKDVVIFGTGVTATLAHFYLTHDSPREVAAFTVTGDHLTADSLLGLPVVPFEDVVSRYSPDEFDMFVAVGYGQINKFRQEMCLRTREAGFNLISYISSKAIVWPDTVIGYNCFIMEQNIIQPFARLGNDIIMWGGSHVGHHSVIEDHVFVSSHVVISGYVTIEPNCFLGVNATIRDGITIARESVIGAGALIMKNTTAESIHVGPTAQVLAFPSSRLPHP
jgi:sugar O-acyltransferase (sialic acid O-acetyltransferase NeuD family)